MKYLKRLLILILIVGMGFVAFTFFADTSGGTKDGIPYRTDTVTRGTIAEVITATGTISPEEVVTVGTQVSGKITALNGKVNDQVKAGQVLAEIDPSILQTQLKQSMANQETVQLAYTLAQRDYERVKELVAKDYVAKVDLERSLQGMVSAKNALENAKIQVERDQVNLGYTKVTSPIDGIIIAQEATSGQTLASNFQTPSLFKIAKDLTVMKIDMNVPESDISKIQTGMPVAFTVDAFPNRQFTGTVTTINLNPNNQSGVVTYNVVVGLDNKDRALFPGMTANITITLSQVTNVLRVPVAALRFAPPKESQSSMSRLFGGSVGRGLGMGGRRGGTPQQAPGQQVYVWKNGALIPVPVTLGATDGFTIEIRSGELKEGDVVATGLLVQEE